jgi:hypothetical protein
LEKSAAVRAFKFIVVALLVIPAAFVAHNFYGDWRSGNVYEQAVRGQSESSIIDELGKPDTVEPCGEFLWWDGDMANPPPNKGSCIKWARYNYFVSAWAFGYSTDGKLVSRYHYVSE